MHGSRTPVTPALSAVYDELLQRACQAPFAEQASACRKDYAQRTGAFPNEHPSQAAREAAGWEDTLVSAGLARSIAATLEDAAERDLAIVIASAQRGLFSLQSAGGGQTFLRDLWGGGAFLLLQRDEIGRAATVSEGAAFLGRIVAGIDGCAVLPGVVWLPAEATPYLPQLIEAARAREMNIDSFAEALLRMDHALSTMSRMKAHHTFRPDYLDNTWTAPRPRT